MADQIESGSTSSPVKKPSFWSHLLSMPKHHKVMISLAVVLLGGGLFGQLSHKFSADSTATPAAQHSVEGQPSGSPGSHLLDGQPPAEAPAKGTSDASGPPGWSPWATRLGGGFIAGFVLGWIIRAFLKTMALVTTAGVLILTGLSYFNVMNIDFTTAKEKYTSAMAWVTDQGTKLFELAKGKVGVTAPTVVGGFFGFRRK